MTTQQKKQSTLQRELYQRAIVDSFVKLNPRSMVRNPVMFVVYCLSAYCSGEGKILGDLHQLHYHGFRWSLSLPHR